MKLKTKEMLQYASECDMVDKKKDSLELMENRGQEEIEKKNEINK